MTNEAVHRQGVSRDTTFQQTLSAVGRRETADTVGGPDVDIPHELQAILPTLNQLGRARFASREEFQAVVNKLQDQACSLLLCCRARTRQRDLALDLVANLEERNSKLGLATYRLEREVARLESERLGLVADLEEAREALDNLRATKARAGQRDISPQPALRLRLSSIPRCKLPSEMLAIIDTDESGDDYEEKVIAPLVPPATPVAVLPAPFSAYLGKRKTSSTGHLVDEPPRKRRGT
jgi:hypothetical protein